MSYLDGALQPEDAESLHAATQRAIKALGEIACGDRARERVANAVLRVACSGYGKSIRGRIDTDAVAEAAVMRFKNTNAPGVL